MGSPTLRNEAKVPLAKVDRPARSGLYLRHTSSNRVTKMRTATQQSELVQKELALAVGGGKVRGGNS